MVGPYLPKHSIPVEVNRQVDEIVERFNDVIIQNGHRFLRRTIGDLDRRDGHILSPRGRIKYAGSMDEWEFAVFKYSSETYDPDEWMFPVHNISMAGLKACVQAYP